MTFSAVIVLSYVNVFVPGFNVGNFAPTARTLFRGVITPALSLHASPRSRSIYMVLLTDLTVESTYRRDIFILVFWIFMYCAPVPLNEQVTVHVIVRDPLYEYETEMLHV